ncbi:erythromycin esterase family protein [Niastella caeni]|uniref:Erythromycin esterase family protein n=1 Tax=Niastella caeni TaxID=2569763 RepID=A0A4S8HIF7_9BACT|nr:erythromycin esterase family protein [Niastella caeni]THU34907.1 erythromycin esterase family protein [Niastella caeni]
MKKRSIAAFAALFCLLQNAWSQKNIEQYVREHAHPITSICPDSTNFADLQVIGDAIGNARIVMLGEQEHGDAATFQAKTRIIKYLHEQKGFDVLAFEGDFFGMNYGWEQVKKEQGNLDSFFKKTLFPIWTYCDACSNLFYQYIPATLKTGHPLDISGFDNQIFSLAAYPALDSVLKRWQLPITNSKEYATDIFPLISHWYNYTKDSVQLTKCLNYLKEIKKQMEQRKVPDAFWTLVIDSMIANIKNYMPIKDYWLKMNIRDRQMAINLKWLTEEKFSGKKIIIWAHNYHISKYGGHYPQEFLNQGQSMGTVYTADTAMNNQTYVLGFTSREGITQWVGRKPDQLPTPKKNSLEKWMHDDYRFAFLDFSGYNATLSGTLENFFLAGGSSNGLGYHRSMLAPWTKIYDGVFYIKEMYGCSEIK